MVQNQNKTKNWHISIILRGGVAAFACWLIAREIQFREVVNLFLESWLVLMQAVIIFVFCQVLIALRWWLFMRAWEIHISRWSAIKLTFMGLYFNNFLPGAVGGDFVRAWYASKYTDRRMASAISVFVDRFFALMATLITAAVALLLVGQKGMFIRQERSPIIQSIVDNKCPILLSFFSIVLLLGGVMIFPAGRRIFKSLFYNVIHYGQKALEQAVDAGKMLLKKPMLFPQSLFMTVFLQFLIIVSLWLVGRQMGIPTELKMYFVFFPVMWVVGSIPISIAGIGVMEGGLIVLFMEFGMVPMELKSAVGALVFAQRAVWLIASLPGLAVYLTGEHLPKGLNERFSIDAKHQMN